MTCRRALRGCEMFFAYVLSFLIALKSEVLAWIFASALRIRTRVMLKNLDIVYSESVSRTQKKRLARKSMASFLRTIFEFICSPLIYPFARVEFKNLEPVQKILAQGGGVYGLAIHQGNWELLIHKGGASVASLHLALKPVGGARVAGWVRARREKNCVHEIMRNVEKPAWQQINEAISAGAIVGFVMDQRRSKGVNVPLFGRPSLTNASLFRQWRGQKAPIFPLTIRRTGLLSHEGVFWDEFEVWDEPGCSEERFLAENAKRMNVMIEKMILWNPDEYFWMHDRWKMPKEI